MDRYRDIKIVLQQKSPIQLAQKLLDIMMLSEQDGWETFGSQTKGRKMTLRQRKKPRATELYHA